eukprot:gene11575-biopygen13273
MGNGPPSYRRSGAGHAVRPQGVAPPPVQRTGPAAAAAARRQSLSLAGRAEQIGLAARAGRGEAVAVNPPLPFERGARDAGDATLGIPATSATSARFRDHPGCDLQDHLGVTHLLIPTKARGVAQLQSPRQRSSLTDVPLAKLPLANLPNFSPAQLLAGQSSHFSLPTSHSSLSTPHFPLPTSHLPLLTPHSSLLTPRSSLLSPHSLRQS